MIHAVISVPRARSQVTYLMRYAVNMRLEDCKENDCIYTSTIKIACHVLVYSQALW